MLTIHSVFARFDESDGMPAGPILDTDGRLWSALWDGACIVQIDAVGRIEQRVPLPVRKTSSLTFGGADYGDIYITTADGDRKQAEGPLAEAFF